MVEIAVSGIKIDLPDNAFAGPPGPAGAGIVFNEWSNHLPPGIGVASLIPYPTGLAKTVTPQSSASRFRLSCTGVVYAEGVIVLLDIRRNGDSLVPVGQTSMFGVSTRGHPHVEPFEMKWIDSPATDQQVTYELYAWTAAASPLWFGRRSVNATINCPTVLSVAELIA